MNGRGKALVTGGAGLIGSHLVDLLLEEGWEVRVLDNLEPQTHPDSQIPPWMTTRAEFVRGDVRDDISVALAMRGIDVVFHQAAFGGFTTEARKYGDVNAGGTAVVMDAAHHAGISKVVVASSQAVYGPGYVRCPDGYSAARRSQADAEAGSWDPPCPVCGAATVTEPVVETQQLLPETPYALSKYHEEFLAFSLGRQWQLPVVALRYALTYGPRQSPTNPYTGIASIFATQLLNGLSPVIYEDGRQTRDFVYVGDVAAANLLVALDDRADGHAFNVGTGVATTVEKFAYTLGRALGCAHVIDTMQPSRWRPGDVRHLVTNAEKLRGLGWEPRVSVREGVALFASWFMEQRLVGAVFPEAEAALERAGVVRSA